MIKYIALTVVALLPGILALFGVHNLDDVNSGSRGIKLAGALLVNIPFSALLGAVTALILRYRRAMWFEETGLPWVNPWAMIIAFVFNYLGMGLLWGTFSVEGYWGTQTVNSSALLAVAAFVGALFTWGLYNVISKQLYYIKHPDKRPQPNIPAPKQKRSRR